MALELTMYVMRFFSKKRSIDKIKKPAKCTSITDVKVSNDKEVAS